MRSCVFCQTAIRRPISISFIFSCQSLEESLACERCLKQFDRLKNYPTCPGCNRKQTEQKFCTDCINWQTKYPTCVPNHQALFTYNTVARQFMNQYKFQGDVALGKLLKEPIATFLKQKTKTHTIVPIPLSEKGQKTRGFNQVEVLLRQAEIPFENWLIYTGEGKKQSSKTKEERLQTKQPFQLVLQKEAALEKPFLIIDDVYTTGRTLYHARILLETVHRTETFSVFR